MVALLVLALSTWLQVSGGEHDRQGPARTLGHDFEQFLDHGACPGPAMVLFASDVDVEAIKAFQESADEVDSLACLGILNCDAWRSKCTEQNIRRTPMVLLYPRGPRGGRFYRGQHTKEGFTAAVAKMVAFNDRTLHVTANNLNSFLAGRARPIKVLLFSRRQRTPVIFKALSSDDDLWPHMEFGFVPAEEDNQKNPLLDLYSVESVPQVVVQYGPEASTKQVYISTEISYQALKEWLMLQRSKLWLGSASWKQEEDEEMLLDQGEEEEDDSSAAAASRYELLEKGTAGCPIDLEIASVTECQNALKELGMRADPTWVSNFPELPSKCSVRTEPTQQHPERMHFNSFVGGAGREDLSPVCKKAHTREAESSNEAKKLQQKMTGSFLDLEDLPLNVQAVIEKLSGPTAGEASLEKLVAKLAEGVMANYKEKKEEASASEQYEYVKLTNGADGCPAGAEIPTFEECRQAILSMGLKPDPYWTNAFEGLPKFCSVREHPDESVGLEKMHFNTAGRGAGRDDLAPVCRKIGTAAGGQAGKPKGASSALLELSGRTQQRLLDKPWWFLVYMKEGPLTEAEEDMLLNMKDRFQRKLDEQRIPLEWLWLDVRAERAVRSLLEPPAIPSAMVIKGGNSPQYALVQHDEQDDEPMPADANSIELLLNSLLGGDARFVRLNAKKLASSWSPKRS